MKIGILGSGIVGQTLGKHLAAKGHWIRMGTRTPTKLDEWLRQNGGAANVGVCSFAEAAAFGEVLIHAVRGAVALDVLYFAGEEALNGKILIDVTNPLDFSKGMPPSLFVCNTDSLAERIQRAFPAVKVVKTLNTLGAALMADPGKLADAGHDLFISGDDDEAKSQVIALLQSTFGWKSVIDLGDISAARSIEMMWPLWFRLWQSFGHKHFNIKIIKEENLA